MKIPFDDGGYLEIQRSNKPHHVYVIVAVKKPDNILQLLVNSAEVHVNKLNEAVKSVLGPIRLEQEGYKNEQDNKNEQNNTTNIKSN